MIRQFLLAAGATAIAITSGLCGPTAQAADKKVTLRFSHFLPPKQKLNVGFREWNNALKKATNGTLSFVFFPSSQLGSARDHYDMIKRGTADAGLINPGYTPGRYPVVGAVNLPFMVSDGLKGAAAMTRYYAKYAGKEMSEVQTCHVFSHEPGTFHANKPIKVPADVKGLKIRTASATISSYVISMGGNAVQVPIMEAFETLKRGITEGITVPWGSLITNNFGKVTKHSLDTPLYVVVFVTGFNKRKFAALSPAHKKAITDTCTPEWSRKIYQAWYDEEKILTKKIFADAKRTIHKIGAKEMTLWRTAAEPTYKQWGEVVKKRGYNPDKLLSELRAELKKDGALAK